MNVRLLRHAQGAFLIAALYLSTTIARAAADEKARHVVLVVWDGMRPDFVTAEDAPNLTQLAQSGVRFRKHHSVYPSLTSVNAAALATGVYPNRSGMIANWAFRPEISGGKLARMDAPETIRKGDDVSGGKYLAAPTIAELVRARGGRVEITGTKTASLLHDRRNTVAARAVGGSVTLFAGTTLPEAALAPIVKLLGPFPTADEIPNTAEDAWTTRALTEVLWSEGVPEFSLLWMSDPDRSQHATAPGTNDSLGAIKSVDTDLGVVLRALEAKGVRAQTDVLLASDHGFSTIAHAVDVAGLLREDGFNLADESVSTLARGQVRVAGNGGLNLYYVGEHDAATIARLVETLQQTDFTSVIFTREPIAGTFPMSQAHLKINPGPDVIATFQWSDQRSANGVAGMIDANGSGDTNKGTHGTLSPFDLHNTFIAAGPDFCRGMNDDLPTANVDVAATIMSILGLNPPEPLDGRVVKEAMVGSDTKEPAVETKTIEASRQLPTGTWHQSLQISTLGTSSYIDQGHGAFEAKH
ncbi:MAG: alkaline phosphatase family protein [Verrucomicrobiota bacterium]|nr:alkaline phosphatase family protein [Verrucomicrobiota bacterium]